MKHEFRHKFIAALEASGMSVAEVSRRSGVSYHVIDKLKKGKIQSTTVENAERLARVLNLDRRNDGLQDRLLASFTRMSRDQQEMAVLFCETLLKT